MRHHVTERFPDFLMNDLDRVQRAEVEAHLAECTLCREEFDTLLRLWGKLGAIPEAEPGAAMRLRFATMLEAYQEGAQHVRTTAPPLLASLNAFISKVWPSQPILQFGLAILLLAAGVFGGTRLSAPDRHDKELSQLRSEMQSMGHLLAISLLNQQSASERLKGVSWSSQIDQPDPQVMTALIAALKYDPNVNVRLASIDALSDFLGDPAVRAEFLGSLPEQESPLVQIALVDVLVQRGVQGSSAVLTKLSKDPLVKPVVRQRVEEGLRQLAGGGQS